MKKIPLTIFPLIIDMNFLELDYG